VRSIFQEDEDDEEEGDEEEGVGEAEKPRVSKYDRLLGLFGRNKPDASAGNKPKKKVAAQEMEAEEEEEEEEPDDEAKERVEGEAGEDEEDEEGEDLDELDGDEEEEDFGPLSIVEGEDLAKDDPYMKQFNVEIEAPPALARLSKLDGVELEIGDVLSSTQAALPKARSTLEGYKVRERLLAPWEKRKGCQNESAQNELLRLMLSYRDVYCSTRTLSLAKDFVDAYVLHVLNHVLKARDCNLRNSAAQEASKDPEQEFRDQGFTRPKVLIIVPFRSRAKLIVERIIKLAPECICQVENKGKFNKEFGVDPDESDVHPSLPQDYKDTFEGNIDDCFRVGLRLNRRSIKLYSDFYTSDVIIASPLGLRMTTGGEKDKQRKFDFLSSIEIAIVDDANVMQMQNWEHVETLFECLSQMPQEQHGADFSRIRNWYLNGWAKYYRQTLVFSSHVSAEVNALCGRHCFNRAGKIRVQSQSEGLLGDIVRQTRQIFQRVECEDIATEDEVRLQHFTSQVLPSILRSEQSHTLLVARSYFDFVRLRNLLKSKEASFASISEYSTPQNIARSRQYFQRGQRRILLMTERFYFFHRVPIKGTHHLVVYSLPDWGKFYPELVNFLPAGTEVATTAIALYTRFDQFQLERIVGSGRALRMLTSASGTHLFC